MKIEKKRSIKIVSKEYKNIWNWTNNKNKIWNENKNNGYKSIRSKDEEKLKIHNVKCFKISRWGKKRGKKKANQKVGIERKRNQIADGGKKMGEGEEQLEPESTL